MKFAANLKRLSAHVSQLCSIISAAVVLVSGSEEERRVPVFVHYSILYFFFIIRLMQNTLKGRCSWVKNAAARYDATTAHICGGWVDSSHLNFSHASLFTPNIFFDS